MEQVLFGGYYDPLDDTDTEYNSLVGGYTWTSATETWRAKIVSTDGVIKQLRVKLSGPPGGADKYSFTLILNGNPTALTLDIIGAATTGSNMVNEITVTGGDLVSLRCIPTDTPTPVYATWSCVFEGDTAAESLIQGGSGFALSNSATEYCQVMGGSNYGITELNYRQIVPTSGTIKDLYVWIQLDPGNAPDAYRFTLRKGGISQTLTVTITADDTTGNDLVNSFAVAAGDVLTMMIEPLNGPSVSPPAIWGMTFVADTDGESIILGATSNNLPQVDTEYNSILPGQDLQVWIANENERYQLGQVCTLKKFYVLLAGSPGAGNKYDFTIRLAGADSNIITTIADDATTGNSGALEDIVALDEYLSLKVVPDSSPTIRDAYWGLVCYIATIQDASADLLGKIIARHMGTPVELLGKADIRQSDSAEILGRAAIRKVGAPVELPGKADIHQSGSAEAYAHLIVRNIAPSEIYGYFIIKNIDISELLGRAVIRHMGIPVDLLGKGMIRQAASVELLGRFEAQATAEVLGKVEVRQPGSTELLSRAVIRHMDIPVELLGRTVIRHEDSAELLGGFEAQATAELLGRTIIRHEGIVELLGRTEVGQDSAELLARFETGQHSFDLLGKTIVRHPTSLDLKFSFYVRPRHLTAAEMLIGGRDRRIDLGGLDRKMVVGGRDRRMRIR